MGDIIGWYNISVVNIISIELSIRTYISQVLCLFSSRELIGYCREARLRGYIGR